MTSNARAPKPPNPPAPTTRRALTPTEQWYLECLGILTRHLKRPPTIIELAGYVDRSHTPVWLAMQSLLAKGYVTKNEDRRYEVVA